MTESSSGPIPSGLARRVRRKDESLSDTIYEEFFRSGSTMSREFFHLMCGDKIGDGVSRSVYHCRINSAYVIKFEFRLSFQNVMEWEVWKAVEEDNRENSPKHWLAPCILISQNGAILLQRRTRPIRKSEIPERIPSWICDASPKNWGVIDGKPVLHDYGYTHFLGAPAMRRMKKNSYPAKPGDFTETPD